MKTDERPMSCACPLTGSAHRLEPTGEPEHEDKGKSYFCLDCDLLVWVGTGRVTPVWGAYRMPHRAKSPREIRLAFANSGATYKGPPELALGAPLPDVLYVVRHPDLSDVIETPEGLFVMRTAFNEAHRWLSKKWYVRREREADGRYRYELDRHDTQHRARRWRGPRAPI